MAVVTFHPGSWKDPGSWFRWRTVVCIVCPRCRLYFGIANAVDDAGDVAGRVQCATPGCSFNEEIKLTDWYGD